MLQLGASMSKVLRISAGVFQKLETNVTGFESPSDVIDRAIKSHEEIEVIKMVARAVISAKEHIDEIGFRKKTVLLHQPAEAIDRAMSFIVEIFPQYKIAYDFSPPGLNLKIVAR